MMMNRGFKMTRNGDEITIQKTSMSYRFDQQIKSNEGELVGLKIKLGKIEKVKARMSSLGTQAMN